MSTRDVPKNPAQRREWIKYELRLRGSSLSAVARELGVVRQAVAIALCRPYPRMEEAIAQKLELSPKNIWPERYAASATPGHTFQHHTSIVVSCER